MTWLNAGTGVFYLLRFQIYQADLMMSVILGIPLTCSVALDGARREKSAQYVSSTILMIIMLMLLPPLHWRCLLVFSLCLCAAVCEGEQACLKGEICLYPGLCRCPPGYYGAECKTRELKHPFIVEERRKITI